MTKRNSLLGQLIRAKLPSKFMTIDSTSSANATTTNPSSEQRLIAELQEKLAKFEREQQLFRNALNSLPQAQVLLNSAGQVVLANRAACALLKVAPETVIKSPIANFFAEEHGLFQHQLTEVLANATPRTFTAKARINQQTVLLLLECQRVDTDGQFPHIQARITDITDRHTAIINRIDSHFFSDIVANNLPSMLAYWSADLRCIYANNQYSTWFNRSPEEMRNLHIKELLGDELFLKNSDYINAVLRGTDQQFERTLIKADGSTGHTLAQYIAHKVDDVVVGFVALVTDISLIKRAQLALISSEAKNRAILKAVPDIILTLNCEMLILEAHIGANDFFGLTKTDIVGHNARNILPPDIAQLYFNALDSVVKTNSVQVFQYSVPYAGFGDRHYEGRAALCTYDSVIIMLRDITESERERRSRELKISQRLQSNENDLRDIQISLKMVSDVTKLGTWIRDIKTNQIWGSTQFRKLFGFSTDQPIQMETIIERVHPADRLQVFEMANSYQIDRQERFKSEFRVLGPNLNRWIAVVWQVEVDEQQQPFMSRGIAIDISERKQIELELQQKQMEVMQLSRVAAMGELSAAIAHEINQPLTAILSNAQAALRYLARPNCDVAKVSEILDDVVSEDKRAGEIIRRLRRLFEKQPGDLQRVDINQVVYQVVRLVRNDVINQGATLLFELQENIPPVLADPLQIEQVLINLIHNACDAIAAIELQSRIIEIKTYVNQHDQIEVSVSDHGAGVPDALQQKVFDTFYSTKDHGLGLGLSICKSIIEANHGQLWYQTKHDVDRQGASFCFALPAITVPL